MHFDETFWVAFAFFAFMALVWRPIGRIIVAALDKRAERIRQELAQAEQLRAEAADLLISYKQKHAQAMQEAEDILKNAQKEAQAMLESAQKDFDAMVKKRMELVQQRITQAEAAALQDIQSNAIDIAMGATRLLLKEKLESGATEALIQAAINELDSKVH